MVDQLLGYRAMHQRPAGQLLRALAVGLAGLGRQVGIVHRRRVTAFVARAAGEFRALTDGTAFVIELPGRHCPALVHLTDDRVVTHVDAVEEFLAELGSPVHLRDAPQGDSRMVDRNQEHGQAVVLGHIPIGAGQAQSVVGGERAGAPGLGAVDHPPVTLAFGARDDAGQVRSAAGLRQQLDQDFIAAQRGPDGCLFCSSLPVSSSVAQQIANVGTLRINGIS